MRKKTNFLIYPLLIMGVFLVFASSCEKDDDDDHGGNNSTGPDISYGEFTDPRDGEVYKTITIGGNEWMAENLRATRYNNGDVIPQLEDANTWIDASGGAWCSYDNNPENDVIYGKLYNWYAVNDERGLAPEGWRVPTNEDWIILEDLAGGEIIAGGKLKATGTIEAGTGLWHDPNTGATNETGFTALPGGYRFDYGLFHYIGDNGRWWSATEYNDDYAWNRYINYNGNSVYKRYNDKECGFSVRCLRN